jgi:hypothetical protein
MPTAKFVVAVRVSTSTCPTSDIGIAEASRYLAYSDQTDLFGYRGKVESINTADVENSADGLVVINFTAPVTNQSEIEVWKKEMDALAKVETARCVSNPV